VDSRHGGDLAVQHDGLPALSVPYALSSEKLPIGIQLVAKWLDEDTILRLGAMLERRGGLSDRHPNI
jgi:aspartyl-tRNA(Asn)/glutamyl-tRNA(Gln) amidotransferase subunit A